MAMELVAANDGFVTSTMIGLMTKRAIKLAIASALLFSVPSLAAGYRLAPYKDELFAYPKVLESAYGGDYVKVEYVELRDINGRDEIPVDKAKPEYLSLETKSVERDLTLSAGRIKLPYIATGKIGWRRQGDRHLCSWSQRQPFPGCQ